MHTHVYQIMLGYETIGLHQSVTNGCIIIVQRVLHFSLMFNEMKCWWEDQYVESEHCPDIPIWRSLVKHPLLSCRYSSLSIQPQCTADSDQYVRARIPADTPIPHRPLPTIRPSTLSPGIPFHKATTCLFQRINQNIIVTMKTWRNTYSYSRTSKKCGTARCIHRQNKHWMFKHWQRLRGLHYMEQLYSLSRPISSVLYKGSQKLDIQTPYINKVCT